MSKEEFKRKLAAILSADVVGYSLLMRDDEEATIRTLTTYRKVMTHIIQQYSGRLVDVIGDNLLAEFASAVDSVNCAVEIQREIFNRNAALPENRRMQFRIGINLGNVVEKEQRIYGDGVNIAARMEGLADKGGVCISATVYEQVKHKLDLDYDYIGKQKVKNIKEPVHAYWILSLPGARPHSVKKAEKAVHRKWRNALVIVSVILVIGAASAVWIFYFQRESMVGTALKISNISDLSHKSGKLGAFRALIIGINDYKDPKIQDLKTAVSDAQAIAELLRDQYSFQVTLLLDRKATGEAIYSALRSLASLTTSNDSVLIYYAGHGDFDRTHKDAWWLPSDAENGNPETYLSSSEIQKSMQNMKARHILLIADSSFNDTLLGQAAALPRQIDNTDYLNLYNEKSRWVMTSGNKAPISEAASEGHSEFAGQLIKDLKKNEKPYLLVQEVYQRIAPVVSTLSEQAPKCLPIKNAGDQGGEFVFVTSEKWKNLQARKREEEKLKIEIEKQKIAAERKRIEDEIKTLEVKRRQEEKLKMEIEKQKTAAERKRTEDEMKTLAVNRRQEEKLKMEMKRIENEKKVLEARLKAEEARKNKLAHLLKTAARSRDDDIVYHKPPGDKRHSLAVFPFCESAIANSKVKEQKEFTDFMIKYTNDIPAIVYTHSFYPYHKYRTDHQIRLINRFIDEGIVKKIWYENSAFPREKPDHNILNKLANIIHSDLILTFKIAATSTHPNELCVTYTGYLIDMIKHSDFEKIERKYYTERSIGFVDFDIVEMMTKDLFELYLNSNKN